MNYLNMLAEYRDREIQVLKSLDLHAVDRVMNVLEEARKAYRHIFICGNGGSAATASHYAGDFNQGVNRGLIYKNDRGFIDAPAVGRFSESVEPLYNFECLSDNIPTMMAVANDESYAEVFRYPLSVKMKAGDIVIGISGSGNSANVVNALQFGKEHGAITIAIVGYDGGKMKEMADYNIHVDIHDMQITEDIHMILDHMMMWTLVHGAGADERDAFNGYGDN